MSRVRPFLRGLGAAAAGLLAFAACWAAGIAATALMIRAAAGGSPPADGSADAAAFGNALDRFFCLSLAAVALFCVAVVVGYWVFHRIAFGPNQLGRYTSGTNRAGPSAYSLW